VKADDPDLTVMRRSAFNRGMSDDIEQHLTPAAGSAIEAQRQEILSS
jgi:hypothetical protein